MPGQTERRRPDQYSLRPVVAGAAVSVVLIAAFLAIEAARPDALKLPDGWILLTVAPVVVGLVVGRYFTYLKTPLGEFGRLELDVPPDVTSAQPGKGKTAYSQRNAEQIVENSALRAAHYGWQAECRDLTLVHAFVPSDVPGQAYDVFVFLARHISGKGHNQAGNLDCIVQSAEFFFGRSWEDYGFLAKIDGGPIGVRVSAWGSFWATCRVTFKPQAGAAGLPDSVLMHRYIDFDSASLL